MRRSLVILAVAAATCVMTAGLSVQASAEPGHPAGHSQAVYSPDGRLASPVHGKSLPGRQNAPKDTPPATNRSSAAGAGCPSDPTASTSATPAATST